MFTNKLATLFIISVALLTIISCKEDELMMKRGETLKVFSHKNTYMDLKFDQQIVIPIQLNNSSHLLIQHSSGSIINQSGVVLIEVKVQSSSLFQVFIREEGFQQLDTLQSIDGIHFYGYRNLKDKKVEIILKSLEYIINTEILYDEETGELFSSDNLVTFQIDITPSEYRVCPFECFGKGFCQPNGQCLCDEGYSQHFHCQTSTENRNVQFDKPTRVFEHQMEEYYQQSKIEEEWKYTSINLLFDDYIQKQIETNHSTHRKPLSVLITFSYKNKRDSQNHKLILLEQNKSYRILFTEQQMEQSLYRTTIEIKFQDFQIKSLININNAYPLTIGHKGCEFIDMQAQFRYKQSSYIIEAFYIVFILSLTIVMIYLIVVLIKKHKNSSFSGGIQQVIALTLDQSEIRLTIDQVNAQIQSQMPSFQYNSPTNKSLNGTHYECFICLNKYQDFEECRITKCGHVFHKDCVDAWLQKSLICPVDRINLSVKC